MLCTIVNSHLFRFLDIANPALYVRYLIVVFIVKDGGGKYSNDGDNDGDYDNYKNNVDDDDDEDCTLKA